MPLCKTPYCLLLISLIKNYISSLLSTEILVTAPLLYVLKITLLRVFHTIHCSNGMHQNEQSHYI